MDEFFVRKKNVEIIIRHPRKNNISKKTKQDDLPLLDNILSIYLGLGLETKVAS
jgi:hypothetical protein